jgi:hypothetical protein
MQLIAGDGAQAIAGQPAGVPDGRYFPPLACVTAPAPAAQCTLAGAAANHRLAGPKRRPDQV